MPPPAFMEKKESIIPSGCLMVFGCLAMLVGPLCLVFFMINPPGSTPRQRLYLRIAMGLATLCFATPHILSWLLPKKAARADEPPKRPPDPPEQMKLFDP